MEIKSIVSSILILLIMVISLGMWGCPKYNVYEKRLAGKARLKEAEWDRQIQIKDAEARKQSATLLGEANLITSGFKAQADSIRAIGTANATKIIAKSITPEYIRWLFVDQLDQTQNQIIYIPTEGNIPIMEAGKR